MALPDYNDIVKGTARVWGPSGTTPTPTHNMTLTSLADNAAREGPKSATWVDGTLGVMPVFLEICFESAVAVAATNGKEIELFFGESDDADAADANPGNLTGVDAALSNPDELKNQLNFVGALVLSNARGTNLQRQRFRYTPLCHYIIPVVVNKAGQALHGTADNHTIIVTPYYLRIVD